MALPINDHFPWVATGRLWRARVNLNSCWLQRRQTCVPAWVLSMTRLCIATACVGYLKKHCFLLISRTITPQMRARIWDSMNSHQDLDSNDFNWNTWHVRGHSRASWQHDTTKDLEELPLARATSTCASSIRELELSAVVVVVVVAVFLLLYH